MYSPLPTERVIIYLEKAAGGLCWNYIIRRYGDYPPNVSLSHCWGRIGLGDFAILLEGSRLDFMDNPFMIVFNLFMVVFLVFLNGFFVAAEFAIVKVRGTRIAQLRTEGNKRAKTAEKVITHLDAYLSATQLGITLASLGLGWIGEPAIARLLEPLFADLLPPLLLHTISFAIAFSIITFLHIVIGELAPKSLAIRRAEMTTLWTARPLALFYKIFYPVIYVLNGTANRLLKWVGIEPTTESQHAHTEEEIRMLMAQSHKSGIIDKAELTLFDNVFEFTDRIAREIMVPRIDIYCLYTTDSFEENYRTILSEMHSRYPLCGEDKDDVIGIVLTKEIFRAVIEEGGDPDLTSLARPAVLVPETLEVKDILQTLQKNRSEMAIVVDEYGGTAGIVTTEDIIEEIVGEIQDEFDDERPFYQKEGEETSIDARLLIEEVNDHFDLDIHDPDNKTIGGWIFSQLEQVPTIGDEVQYGGFVFRVSEIDHRSISRLSVKEKSTGKER